MMFRRSFLKAAATLPAASLFGAESFDLAAEERPRVLRGAEKHLNDPPITVTAANSSRSAGGKHDYFSEGDYWWPDPKNPDGPYIQRDGMTNPQNFVAHRQAMMRLSVQAPALCAAWVITKERRYADHAARHLRAWFIDEATRMNANLQFAQAIHGVNTGRGTGIIDTIHLVEVVRGASVIDESGALSAADRRGIRQWFADYLTWLTTSKNGRDERDAKNNHGTCWVMQAAEFAQYTGNSDVTNFCRERFKNVLLAQMANDGSFPQELRRTKPYNYSIFNLETMSAACQILSDSRENLWQFELPDGRSMKKAAAFLYPYLADKSKWPYSPDVMYYDQWPVRQVSLLFAGLAYNEPKYLELWAKLNPDPAVEETIRNYPIRQPVLWV
jgi:hypothetical protein